MSMVEGIKLDEDGRAEIIESPKTPYQDILFEKAQKELSPEEQQSRIRSEARYKKLLGIAMMASEARTYGNAAEDLAEIKGRYEDPLQLKDVLTNYIDDRIRMDPSKYRNGENNPKYTMDTLQKKGQYKQHLETMLKALYGDSYNPIETH
jgi:hypothetical protein